MFRDLFDMVNDRSVNGMFNHANRLTLSYTFLT